MGVVRIFLALVVVTAHFQQIITRPNNLQPAPEKFSLGFHSAYAVLFFYVISGFLITFTLTRNYVGRPDGVTEFYKNRAVRIFSLYWPLLIIAFLMLPGAARQFLAGTPLDQFTNVFLIGADWNLDFSRYPEDNWNAVPAGLHPAWTLGAELTFYMLAPFLVRNWRVGLALFLVSLLLRAILVSNLGTHIVERWTYYFTPSTFLFFLAGQGACLLSNRYSELKSHRFGLVFMAASFLTMFFTHDTGFDIPRLWVSITLFTIGLPGFFDATKSITWMNVLGNWSYPVYLTHPLVAIVLGPRLFYGFKSAGLDSQGYLPVMISAFILCCIFAGAAAHYIVEKPTALLMKFILTRKYEIDFGKSVLVSRSKRPSQVGETH